MLALVLDFCFGIAMGVLGGFFGIGGGLVAIPIMTLWLDQSQTMAQGTALIMMVPNVVLALWRYQQRTPLNWKWVFPLGLAALLSAGYGARIATEMDAHLIQVGFAVLMLLLATLNLFRSRLATRSTATARATSFRLAALGGGCGALGGFFGVGASVVAVPVLTGVFGFSQVAAQGMALSLALPSSLITLITYGLEGHVDWSMGAAMALGGLFSVSLGVRLAYRAPEKLLCGLFSCFLAGSAALLLIRA
ncbi:sulfite exporter TauE/SafE family protein [Pseudomonas sp. zjy_8]|uniref:sulfite exporter TauE/SafE family protein n=1 Tax=Pseudomonas sp. GLN_2 TaxID=3367180 RepID=UPI00370C6015